MCIYEWIFVYVIAVYIRFSITCHDLLNSQFQIVSIGFLWETKFVIPLIMKQNSREFHYLISLVITYVCTYACVYMHVCVCICVYTYVCMHVCMHVCTCVCICMHVQYVYVAMYVRMSACTYVCTYILYAII